jgi:Tol biopolymer transport system component
MIPNRARLRDGPFDRHGPALSPDGGWIAYTSSGTGRDQVCVQPYPEGRCEGADAPAAAALRRETHDIERRAGRNYDVSAEGKRFLMVPVGTALIGRAARRRPEHRVKIVKGVRDRAQI